MSFPIQEETESITVTVTVSKSTADAIRSGQPYRVEPIPKTADPEIIASNPDPSIVDKPKRPGLDYKDWKEFCDAGMLWWVNRGLHLLGWVLVAMIEEDGTISGVYPARTRYRGFSEKDESEGFRKVTADIQAHMTELVEDCADET